MFDDKDFEQQTGIEAAGEDEEEPEAFAETNANTVSDERESSQQDKLSSGLQNGEQFSSMFHI